MEDDYNAIPVLYYYNKLIEVNSLLCDTKKLLFSQMFYKGKIEKFNIVRELGGDGTRIGQALIATNT